MLVHNRNNYALTDIKVESVTLTIGGKTLLTDSKLYLT